MIIAYHAIFTTHGTWLPNDPRGSYSVEVYNQELRALGAIRYGRQDPQPSKAALRRFHVSARPRLKRPPYFIDRTSRPVIASAFAGVIERLDLTVRACAIMNEHVHVVVERSGDRIEYLVGQLKGAATGELGLARTPWARRCWKVFLNGEGRCGRRSHTSRRTPPWPDSRPRTGRS